MAHNGEHARTRRTSRRARRTTRSVSTVKRVSPRSMTTAACAAQSAAAAGPAETVRDQHGQDLVGAHNSVLYDFSLLLFGFWKEI